MSAVTKKFNRSILLFTGLLLAQTGHAAVMIDDFLAYQRVENASTLPAPVTTGTQLSNLTRILTASQSADSGASTKVIVDDYYGQLSIANNASSKGSASIFYSFNSIDLTAVADALVFDLDFVDLIGHQIQVIANTNSVYGFAAMNVAGLHSILFSEFTDPLVFQHLTSLQINFRGERNWDALYGSISTSTKVSEPSIFALLSIGLMLMSRVSRKAYA